MTAIDVSWWHLFSHFLALSLLAVGAPSPWRPTCTATW